jgi:hypothetical protein
MNKEDDVNDNVNALNIVNYQIAELARIKEELEARICALLEHGDDYSKTYLCNKFKVTIKTSYIYTLDKDEFETMGSLIPSRFNPVTKKTSYHLDKQIIRDAESYCSEKELSLFNSMISKKPAKLSVSIKAGI